jgi:hypothetical protein
MSDPFDPVLRAAARRARPAGVCPDPEMLAGYLDSGLTSDERAAVEVHAADCPRCQQHLSLLGAVSMERPDPDAVAPRHWLVRWGWMVPVATAVLVVAVWTRTPAPVEPPAQFPQREVAPAVVPAPQPTPPAVGESSPADGQRRQSRDSRSVTPPFATAEADRERQDFAAEQRQQPPSPAAPPAVAQSDRLGQLADSAAPAAAKEAAAGTAPVREEAKLMRKAAAPALEATAADDERYRAGGGRIERSQDGGASWQEVFSDASLTFTAVSCATEGACWFGTSTGVMLRTSQSGLVRSRLPDSLPVTAISAVSATEAIVTAGARRYRTSDGLAWISVP